MSVCPSWMGRELAGDPQDKADIQRELELARAGNFLPGALRLALEADQTARRFGTRATLRWTHGALIGLWFELGNWDKCGPAADEFPAESAALGPHYQDTWIRVCRSWMRLVRGDTQGALQDQRESLIRRRSRTWLPRSCTAGWAWAATPAGSRPQPSIVPVIRFWRPRAR